MPRSVGASGVRRFGMATELFAHRGKHAMRVAGMATGREAIEQGGSQHRHRNRFVQRSLQCPPAFAGVRHMPLEARQFRVGVQRVGGEIEQPGSHHASAPPDLRDRGQVEAVAVVLGMDQRCGLGIGGPLLSPAFAPRSTLNPSA